MSQLNKTEMLRYSRHFSVIGVEGQHRLKQAKVLCIGAGGLGCPALQYLTAAGVGTIGIVDHDQVSISNLHRQILYTENDIGQLKVKCAAERLSAQNPHIQLITYSELLNEDNATALIGAYDIVLDGSDNYKTRYLINDVCFLLKKPLVSASIFQFQGQVSVFNLEDGPCYRCLYTEPPPPELSPNCDISGVLGLLPGMVGTIQATEVVKLIVKKGRSLAKRLLQIDALTMNFKEYEIKKNPDCPLCFHGELSNTLFIEPASIQQEPIIDIEPTQLKAWLNDSSQKLYLIDVREPYERSICSIGGEHMPSSQFNLAGLTIDERTPIIVYCKLGGRSQKIARLLKTAGFSEVYSLKGGIISWIEEIDPAMVMY